MGRSTDSTRRFRIKETLINDFTYQLRLLLSQSYLIQESLQMMTSFNTHPRIKKLIQLIINRLERGFSLAESLDHIQYIDRFYITMVNTGELSGNLSLQMTKLLEHLEKKRLYRQKLNKASLYPTLVFSVTLVAGIVFIAFAVPMLVNFAQSLQVTLPPSTQRFIALLSWLHVYYMVPLAGITLILLIFSWFYRRFPYLVDYWKCSLPYFGKIIVERDMALFCQQISFLLSSHISLQDSLGIASFSIQNRYLREQIEIGSAQLSYGNPVSSSLQPLFRKHPFLLTALKTGEESNRLAENFAYLSAHYQQTLQVNQDRVLVLIEPLMLLTIGLFVFLIIVQFYLPIFQLLNQVDFLNT
ncbi:MAG: type II secretion system F family protein [Caldisericia bacterium]|nr:type II secretion system F family protein [Caldisericia bacterium]